MGLKSALWVIFNERCNGEIMPNKLVTIAVILFLAYTAFNNSNHNKSPIPRIPLPKEIFEQTDKDQSIFTKALKLIGKPEDLRQICGISKLQLSSQPILAESYKIFETKTGNRPIKCGDEISFNYKIYKLDGSIIFENKAKIKLGDINIPYALHKALIYSNHNSNLTIISPFNYLINNILLESLESFYPQNISLSTSEMMMIDINMI
jgi:hypothetical protein